MFRVNFRVISRNIKIRNLDSDLADGIVLNNLLEVLSGKTLPKYNKKTVRLVRKYANCWCISSPCHRLSERITLASRSPS